MIFGNIVDNITSPKRLLITCECLLGLVWIICGLLKDLFIFEDGLVCWEAGESRLNIITEFLCSGIILICILTIHNWFSARMFPFALTCFFTMQFLGYVTPTHDLSDCEYLNRENMFYYIFGSCLILLGLIDVWTFSFYPLERNVFLDQEETDQKLLSSQLDDGSSQVESI